MLTRWGKQTGTLREETIRDLGRREKGRLALAVGHNPPASETYQHLRLLLFDSCVDVRKLVIHSVDNFVGTAWHSAVADLLHEVALNDDDALVRFVAHQKCLNFEREGTSECF